MKANILKIRIIGLCALPLLLGLPQFSGAFAATVSTQATVASPSGTSTSPEASTSADEKVQEIRDAISEKVQEKIQEIKEKMENKGYVGTLTEMTVSILTLDTLTGEKMVSLDEKVTIVGIDKKIIKVKDLEIDQKIICMGTLNDNKILVAKRIVVVAPPTKVPPKREAFVARVTSLDLKQKTVSLSHLRKLSKQYLIKIDKNTKFISGSFEDLKTDQILIVVFSVVKENETPLALIVNPLKN